MSNKKKIDDFLKKIEGFNLPEWEKLPDLDLYKDQVVTYISKIVNGVTENNCLTDSMINNYVKGKIIPAPNQKKYNTDHIAQIIGVIFLKSILPINEIKKIYDSDYQVNKLYEILRSTLHDTFINTSIDMNQNLQGNNLENLDSIKLLAIDLAIKAYTHKMLSLQLLSLIEETVEDKPEEKTREIKAKETREEKKKDKKKERSNSDNMLESETK